MGALRRAFFLRVRWGACSAAPSAALRAAASESDTERQLRDPHEPCLRRDQAEVRPAKALLGSIRLDVIGQVEELQLDLTTDLAHRHVLADDEVDVVAIG